MGAYSAHNTHTNLSNAQLHPHGGGSKPFITGGNKVNIEWVKGAPRVHCSVPISTEVNEHLKACLSTRLERQSGNDNAVYGTMHVEWLTSVGENRFGLTNPDYVSNIEVKTRKSHRYFRVRQ